MDLKFGLATPSQLWSLDWADRQALLKAIDAAGFNHVFLADHVSFRNGAGADGFVETRQLLEFSDHSRFPNLRDFALNLDKFDVLTSLSAGDRYAQYH